MKTELNLNYLIYKIMYRYELYHGENIDLYHDNKR